MIAVRMMPLSVCLLLGAVGCAEMQKSKSAPAAAPAPSAGLVTKADMDSLRVEYMRKLHLQNTSQVRDAQVKELVFFNFREDTGPAHAHFQDLDNALKRLVESKNARISELREMPEQVSFKYERGDIHGSVLCELKSHRDSELPLSHWNINLTVKEEQWH